MKITSSGSIIETGAPDNPPYRITCEPAGITFSNFPGGWKGDKTSVFNGTGLSVQQMEAKDLMKALLNFRKQSMVLNDGKLLHFAPNDGIYTYFRYDEQAVVMIVISKIDEEKLIA